ncbi:hypothetical protein Patl1_07700 [Pistacia atlantica]|uniref:Uncharacterized protein n=1 Tax=Pistacia atlantica TaxID=434234 RepID=A0ACC1AJX5_9ROSI|nr:hypothetical protein Patl1_07700 [Pistacia atlantica]
MVMRSGDDVKYKSSFDAFSQILKTEAPARKVKLVIKVMKEDQCKHWMKEGLRVRSWAW